MIDHARNTLLGALVADAASMGFHWLYDQDRVAALGGETPEFRTPDPADFEGAKGYFAHGGKPAGALSHYGEQCLVMMRAVAAGHGYDRAIYEAEFQAAFGYGGTFSGYIDRPTRATLDAMSTDPESSGFHGADDVQLPAVSKLPAVVVAHGADGPEIENAVRVTNNSDVAVAYGQFVAGVMADVLGGRPAAEAVRIAVDVQEAEVGEAVRKAVDMSGTTIEVTRAIGMSCYLEYGVPSVVHNILHSTDFKQAIRTNILAGGDNCGRAIILGALMGAEFGVPQDWVEKLVDLPEIESLIQAIV